MNLRFSFPPYPLVGRPREVLRQYVEGLDPISGKTHARSRDTGGNFAEGSINQLMGNARIMIIVGFIMLLFAAVPGLPTLSMGFIGLVFAGLGYALYKYERGELVLTSAPAVAKKGSPAGAGGTLGVPAALAVPAQLFPLGRGRRARRVPQAPGPVSQWHGAHRVPGGGGREPAAGSRKR